MGYKRHMFTSAIDPQLICISCEDVYRDPWTSICGHTLCHDCWLNRVETSNDPEDEYVTCMHCRTQSSLLQHKLKFNEQIHESIMSLVVKCGNFDCRKQMPLMNREMHMEVCKYNNKSLHLCCLKPSRRTNRIMRRTRNLYKAVSGRVLFKLCNEAMNSAFATYTQRINVILDPLAAELGSIERMVDPESSRV